MRAKPMKAEGIEGLRPRRSRKTSISIVGGPGQERANLWWAMVASDRTRRRWMVLVIHLTGDVHTVYDGTCRQNVQNTIKLYFVLLLLLILIIYILFLITFNFFI